MRIDFPWARTPQVLAIILRMLMKAICPVVWCHKTLEHRICSVSSIIDVGLKNMYIKVWLLVLSWLTVNRGQKVLFMSTLYMRLTTQCISARWNF